jgi:hypothetical protein
MVLGGHSLCRENITSLLLDPSTLRVNRRKPCFRGTFHGPTVIAHPLAGEKRVTVGTGRAEVQPGRVGERLVIRDGRA